MGSNVSNEHPESLLWRRHLQLALNRSHGALLEAAIALDPRWRDGNYYEADPGDGPHAGLATARG